MTGQIASPRGSVDADSTGTKSWVSFEDVVFHIGAGDEVSVFEHPNQLRYPDQKISVVLIEGYAYLVPFVESDSDIFLKTIIASRKASKQYVGDSDDQA